MRCYTSISKLWFVKLSVLFLLKVLHVFSGMLKKIILVLLIAFLAWAYQATRPPPPRICGSPTGPPITAPRIKLRDGRHLAYKEHGIPKEMAKYKIIAVPGFASSRHDLAIITSVVLWSVIKLTIFRLSGCIFSQFSLNDFLLCCFQGITEELEAYFVSFDRPGYGESEPDPKRTLKSTALDIEELADQLELKSKFHVIGLSMGGQLVWGCLKYIPHRYLNIDCVDIFLYKHHLFLCEYWLIVSTIVDMLFGVIVVQWT